MLSILFDEDREWWVSGATFDRLVQSALDSGALPAELADLRRVANANGGLSLDSLEPAAAARLVTALRTAAQRDVTALADADPASEDGGYRAGITRFLDLFRPT
jgi:hypothetical protein